MTTEIQPMRFGEFFLNGDMEPLVDNCYRCNNLLHSKKALYIRYGVVFEIIFVLIFNYGISHIVMTTGGNFQAPEQLLSSSNSSE